MKLKNPDYDLLVQLLIEGEITQKDIACQVGLSQPSVSDIANGLSKPWLQERVAAGQARVAQKVREAKLRWGLPTPGPRLSPSPLLCELDRAKRWISYAYARYLWDRELADENNLHLRFAQMIVKSAKPIVDTDALLKLYRQVARTKKVAEKTPLDAKIA